MIGPIIYLMIGAGYSILENHLFKPAWPEEPGLRPTMKFLCVAQMVIHLFRVALTWPLYLAEDLLIFMVAFSEAHDPEGPNDV